LLTLHIAQQGSQNIHIRFRSGYKVKKPHGILAKFEILSNFKSVASQIKVKIQSTPPAADETLKTLL
jgi:hypothetical protein